MSGWMLTAALAALVSPVIVVAVIAGIDTWGPRCSRPGCQEPSIEFGPARLCPMHRDMEIRAWELAEGRWL